MCIRVIVLLDKGGTNTDVHHLGSLTIANDSTGTRTRRNYDVAQHQAGNEPAIARRARVVGHPSKAVSIWKLVARALKELGHE